MGTWQVCVCVYVCMWVSVCACVYVWKGPLSIAYFPLLQAEGGDFVIDGWRSLVDGWYSPSYAGDFDIHKYFRLFFFFLFPHFFVWNHREMCRQLNLWLYTWNYCIPSIFFLFFNFFWHRRPMRRRLKLSSWTRAVWLISGFAAIRRTAVMALIVRVYT